MSLKRFAWWSGALLFGVCGRMMAAVPEAASGPAQELNRYLSIGELFDKGGSLMYVLAAMSVIAVALVIYNFVVLRAEQVVPRSFRRDILGRIKARAWDEVRTACEERPSPFAEIVVSAVEHVQAAPRLDPNLLKDVIEGEGARQGADVQGEPQYLLDVAVIAPMVGLLGTVFGMIQAFNVVALDLAKAKPMLLAAGVSEALITTAAGLIIGIPAMAFYAYFRGRAAKLVAQMETAGSEVMSAIIRTSKE